MCILCQRFSIIWWSKSANCSMTEYIVVVLKEEYKNYLSRRIQDLSCISLNSIFNNNTLYASTKSQQKNQIHRNSLASFTSYQLLILKLQVCSLSESQVAISILVEYKQIYFL